MNIWEAIDAAATKPFGFTRFTPGPGVGGHCLPVDPLFLSWKIREDLGVPSGSWNSPTTLNRPMPDYVVRRVVEALDKRGMTITGSRILLLGLTYKFNATDLRNSPSARVAELLSGLGAEVLGADPNLPDGASTELTVRRVDATPEEVATSDAAVLLMDHTRFDLTMIQENATWVIDCRNRMSGANVRSFSLSRFPSDRLPIFHPQEFSCATEWEHAHTDYTVPAQRRIPASLADSEGDWRHYLERSTPNGWLIRHNAMTEALVSDSR